MNRIYQLAAAVIYVILFFALFPWYRYVFDIDGVGYIHVATRLAKGEYFNSIAGTWSPLGSWLIVPFVKSGFDPALTAKYVNGVLGLLTLYSCYSLLDKFNINDFLKRFIPFILVILLTSFSFYELFADLLVLFLLTLYLHLIFSKNFIHNNYKIAFAGLLGALCYYAKAYCFPFFLIHFSLVVFVLLKSNGSKNLWKQLIKKAVIAFITFFILVAPYVIALSIKFGSPRISNANKLCMSWFLSPGISDSRKMVSEPPFVDGTSTWDEPIYAQDKFVTPFTSFHYFLEEIRGTCDNTILFTKTLNDISIFSFAILIGFAVYLFKTKKETVATEWLLMATTIIYPVGYLFVAIDWRYFWLVSITLLLMAAILLTYLLKKGFFSKKIITIASIVTCLSFIDKPLKQLKDQKYGNKDLYDIAAIFKQHNIKGNFFLNYKTADPYCNTTVLCYLDQSKFYGPVPLDYTFDELMKSAKQYNIDYYLYYYQYPNEKEIFLQSPYAKAGVKVYDDLYAGLIVVQLK